MTAAETTKKTGMLRVTLASLFGTTLEFYDHFLYGSAAAIIFPAVFFVNMSPMVALLLSLVTYSVAFLARPLGAIIFWALRRSHRPQERAHCGTTYHGLLDVLHRMLAQL